MKPLTQAVTGKNIFSGNTFTGARHWYQTSHVFALDSFVISEQREVRDRFRGGSCLFSVGCHRGGREGGRDGCTSPSWNALSPFLSVSVFPTHDGLYPALLYASSYAHVPVLSLSLWHVSLNKQK